MRKLLIYFKSAKYQKAFFCSFFNSSQLSCNDFNNNKKKSFAVIKKEREIAAAVVNHAIWVLKAYGNKILENGNKLKDLLTTILRAYAITDKGENAVIVVDLLSGSSCKMYTLPHSWVAILHEYEAHKFPLRVFS